MICRSDALTLAQHYERRDPSYTKQLCEWLTIEPRRLTFMLEQHRNKQIWTKAQNNLWVRGVQMLEAPMNQNRDCCRIESRLDFRVSPTMSQDRDEEYITIGKGYGNAE